MREKGGYYLSMNSSHNTDICVAALAILPGHALGDLWLTKNRWDRKTIYRLAVWRQRKILGEGISRLHQEERP